MHPLNPIRDDELEHLFAALSRWPVWLIAVSGGPDSLALMHLLARWHALSKTAATITVATVDHGLRSASAAEANFVATQAHALGLPHVTLPWIGDKPASGTLNAARNARYGLLVRYLASLPGSPRALITAHHQDDQAETVLMRLARGSGVDGLAAMAPIRVLSQDAQISLVRPLLDVAKTRLEDTLRARNQTWVDDPTNTDLTTERAQLRQLSPFDQTASHLSPVALCLTARRMARAREALEHATTHLEAQSVTAVPSVSTTITRDTFAAAPFDLRVRLMTRILLKCGGTHPSATLAEIETLIERLETATRASTLGGCHIDLTRDTMTIYREPGRLGLPKLQLQPGTGSTWDDRFYVSLAACATTPCEVRAMTPDEWHTVRKGITSDPTVTTLAALTIPSFWVNGDLVALPYFGHGPDAKSGQSAWYQAMACPKAKQAAVSIGPLAAGECP